jgi:RHS repeat-associated protein
MTYDGVKTYTYDFSNRLTSASGSPTANLSYDPIGRLYQVAAGSTVRFVYDGVDVIAEVDTSGAVLRRYVHGAGMDEPLVWFEGAGHSASGTPDRRHLYADERGSVVAVESSTVTVNKYDAYGVPASDNVGRFQYTGQMWIPEMGLYHYKARAYSPQLGRFMQTDPIGYGDGMNIYAYVGNDPMNWKDPSGTVRVEEYCKKVRRHVETPQPPPGPNGEDVVRVAVKEVEICTKVTVPEFHDFLGFLFWGLPTQIVGDIVNGPACAASRPFAQGISSSPPPGPNGAGSYQAGFGAGYAEGLGGYGEVGAWFSPGSGEYGYYGKLGGVGGVLAGGGPTGGGSSGSPKGFQVSAVAGLKTPLGSGQFGLSAEKTSQGPEPIVDVAFSGPGAANTVGGFVGGEATLGVSCGKLG